MSSRDDGDPSDAAGWDRPRTILVAVDGSPGAAEAMSLGVQMAAEHGAEVVFVHAVPAIDVVPPVDVEEAGYARPHEPTALDHSVLDDAAAYAAEHGIIATTQLLAGPAAAAIAAHGEACDADVIVVGCQGHRAVTGALLGSVSLGVLRDSTRRVLIVRGPAAKAGDGQQRQAAIKTVT